MKIIKLKVERIAKIPLSEEAWKTRNSKNKNIASWRKKELKERVREKKRVKENKNWKVNSIIKRVKVKSWSVNMIFKERVDLKIKLLRRRRGNKE